LPDESSAPLKNILVSVIRKSCFKSRRLALTKEALRDRHETWCGMRWTQMAHLTKRANAYGQAVWSCPLDAGVKLRNAICAATVAIKPDTPGRARSSRKAIVQGMPE
jgi:hypothetical protein